MATISNLYNLIDSQYVDTDRTFLRRYLAGLRTSAHPHFTRSPLPVCGLYGVIDWKWYLEQLHSDNKEELTPIKRPLHQTTSSGTATSFFITWIYRHRTVKHCHSHKHAKQGHHAHNNKLHEPLSRSVQLVLWLTFGFKFYIDFCFFFCFWILGFRF